MAAKEYTRKRTFVGRIPHGSDLLNSLTDFVKEKGIKLGRLQMIGAVQRAVAGFYDSEAEKYENFVFEKPMEVLSFTGNVSLKDGQPFIHAHITLGDEKGQSFGGHLMEGTTVFAAEFIIQEFEGEDLERKFDKTTGLALWDI
jgi:predicted DNA-binding protein with PD1-like motif